MPSQYSKFQRVSRLAFVTAATSLTGRQPNFARCLAVSWAGTLLYTFLGALALDRILSGAKCTLRPSLAFAYIGSVIARHSSSGRQPNFAASYKERNYGTFADGTTYIRQGGHHAGHRPAFQLPLSFRLLIFIISLISETRQRSSALLLWILVALLLLCNAGDIWGRKLDVLTKWSCHN